MYGFQCDQCDYVTQSEDDHKVTDDGEYLCLPCAEKYEKEQKEAVEIQNLPPSAPPPKPCPR